MKRVIRKGVFETNSSTSHSCVIMTEEQNKKWEEENLYYYPSSRYYNQFKDLPEDKQPHPGCFYTQEEVLEFYKLKGYEYKPDEFVPEADKYDDAKDEFIREMSDFVSYNSWHDDEYMEFDDNYLTTPGGERVVVECKFGRDG